MVGSFRGRAAGSTVANPRFDSGAGRDACTLGVSTHGIGCQAVAILSDNERNTFTRSLGFMNVFDLSDTAQAAIASASARGRMRVAELSASPGSVETLAGRIQMDGWRRRAVQWAQIHDPGAVPGYFTMTDYLRLGSGGIASDWAGWGMADSDCHCLRLPSRFEWWATIGREQRGILAAQVTDLNLHLAVTLERLHLPPSLTKAVLVLALQQYPQFGSANRYKRLAHPRACGTGTAPGNN